MKYLLVALATIIALPMHWHYYRWCIFNIKFNRPSIYRSYKGDLPFLLSKLLLLGATLYFFKWYFVFIPLIIFLVLKEMAFYQSLNTVKKGYISDGLSEAEAVKMARREIKGYHK